MDDKSDDLQIAPAEPGDRRGLSVIQARGLIVAAVLIVFSPVLLADFSGWDDRMNVTGNAALHPPTLQSVAGFWRGPTFHMYAPLTYTVWAGLMEVFSDRSALPFHATNLLAHLIAALAVFEILRIVSLRVSTACLGTLVFALHPLAVEPVAWVTGLRDVLAEMFGFVALALYLRPGGGKIVYTASTALLLAGLASKPSIAVLPIMALLIDLALRQRSVPASLLRAVPWLLAGAICVLIGRSAQGGSHLAPIPHLTDRLLIMLDSYSFYLRIYVWPFPLGLDYGRRPERVLERGWASLSWLPAIVFLIATATIAVLRRSRWVLVILACGVFALLPTSGLLSFDFQAYSTVGDRYAYVALLAPALGAAQLSRVRWRACIAGLVVIWGALSFAQALTWRTIASVSRQGLRANPSSWMSLQTLAAAELADDQPRLAFEHARQAVRLNPQLLQAGLVAGQAAQRLGDYSAARQAFNDVLQQQPYNVWAENGLAESLVATGQTAEGFAAYQHALDLNPNNLFTLTNFAASLAEHGEFDRAEALYRQALQIEPGNADALLGLKMIQQRSRP